MTTYPERTRYLQPSNNYSLNNLCYLMQKKAIIIGAGPAGLTAAYELLQRTDIIPVILEKSTDIGGISKTVNYKGNRIDIGGHRFFSKSDRVMDWWMTVMPLDKEAAEIFTISYQQKTREVKVPKKETETDTLVAENPDLIMLVRKRLSRIYFLKKFFTYPIQLSIDTLRKLGIMTTIKIMISYLYAQLFPRKNEKTLEDFMINRFGKTLYLLFFKHYTEKVWGVPCNEISAEWGAQRIKGISIGKAIAHAAKSAWNASKPKDIKQKNVETSLIEQFLYPKHGPGQLWEEVARQVTAQGATILMQHDVTNIIATGDRITAIETVDRTTGEKTLLEGDYFFSTMPVQELVAGLKTDVPANVREVAAGLLYRDFITIGILLKNLSFENAKTKTHAPITLQDTWIYIQEKDVKVGRLQLFNNWSPYMVKDPDTTWVGMEYFCNKGDDFWALSDTEIRETAIHELCKIGLARKEDVLDATVLRMEKTYPAYFGTYDRFDEIRNYLDSFGNLFLVGRNGMHKYNNSDHSMLTAMVAVDNIAAGITTKNNIWSINTEQEYHEEKK
nr:NAD(P)/FAD-dependent oxidoreductase [Chitinophaga sp. HK235]